MTLQPTGTPQPDTVLPTLLRSRGPELLAGWLEFQQRDGGVAADADNRQQAARFLDALADGVESGGVASGTVTDISGEAWAELRELLEELSRKRALEGYSPSQTATFVFSLKQPLFELLRHEIGADAGRLAAEIWVATALLDRLGVFTIECFIRTREEVIGRQQAELLELSTPVVKLWDGVLALPLIGTLDSHRTQIVMESLLEQIVATGCEIAIIDISGVPTVDTLVAQHLIKTISAARLMGADCIISGIRPQIAQTIVHLGLDLNVISKATMADAFALALRRTGRTVVKQQAAAARPPS
jgi:rsbT co-antagonist protein RsbR